MSTRRRTNSIRTNGATHPNAELVRVMAQRDHMGARLSGALDALAGLVRVMRDKDFMFPAEQSALRTAKAVLVDNGRKVSGE